MGATGRTIEWGGIEGKVSWEGLAPVQFISSYFSVGGKQRARQTNDVYKSLFLINEHNESRKFQKKKLLTED